MGDWKLEFDLNNWIWGKYTSGNPSETHIVYYHFGYIYFWRFVFNGKT